MSWSLHLSNKIQLTIIPNIEFRSGNVWIQKSLLMCPYLWILDRVISTKVTHPNIVVFFSNIWSFRRSISWWPLPKTSMSSEAELWDQITPVYLNWLLASSILSEILYNAKLQSILKFLKDNVPMLCLNFKTKMNLFRVMFLTLLLCKMAFSCINSQKNTERYPVTLSYSIKEITPEFDGCSSFALITKKDKLLKYFHLYKTTHILRNFNNMPRI